MADIADTVDMVLDAMEVTEAMDDMEDDRMVDIRDMVDTDEAGEEAAMVADPGITRKKPLNDPISSQILDGNLKKY